MADERAVKLPRPGQADGCGVAEQQATDGLVPLRILPMAGAREIDDEPCCGPPQAPSSSPYEKAGYRICSFVEGFKATAVGMVPRVSVRLGLGDLLGTVRARSGYLRDQYTVAPGLHCVGNPGKNAPVLVTANYKLTFDSLRRELTGIDAWILVLDTRGVNVWCAAGKKNFSTDQVIRQVGNSRLKELVSHRRLILPQLGAPGVSAHKVKQGCGFSVQWGPIRARHLKEYLQDGCVASGPMRRVTFTFLERMILVPVEIYLIIKPTLWILLAIFVVSGIGPAVFSFSAAWTRGISAATAYAVGVLAGAVAVPAFLPWLPSRKFYVKGIFTGLLGGGLVLAGGKFALNWEAASLLLFSTAVSSYAAMNFTGTTPYTSPTGVEREMRQGIPLQAVSALVAAISWLVLPFFN